jgi:hypothetical protein
MVVHDKNLITYLVCKMADEEYCQLPFPDGRGLKKPLQRGRRLA